MTQKTVRFYDDAPEDINALQALNEYKKYGYSSSRQMIIDALNRLAHTGGNGAGEINIEELAEKIVEKLGGHGISFSESVTGEREETEATYNKAISFMESL